MASKYKKNCVFLKVDVDQNKGTASRFGVTSMPTFLFFHKEQMLEKFAGGDASRLESTIARLTEQYAKNVFDSSGGVALGGGSAGKRVNPWADPNFKPPSRELAQVGPCADEKPSSSLTPASTSASKTHATAKKKQITPQSTSKHTNNIVGLHSNSKKAAPETETEVVCEGDTCSIKPKKASKNGEYDELHNEGGSSGSSTQTLAPRKSQKEDESVPVADSKPSDVHDVMASRKLKYKQDVEQGKVSKGNGGGCVIQ